VSIKRDRVYELIDRERERQKEKWGEPWHSPEEWLHLLLEELGEVGACFAQNRCEDFADEVVHLAAVAVAALEQHGGYLYILFGRDGENARADSGSG
jgi:NTP pyrophosphatase (non-canonical NTP hydrolase)